MGDGEEEWPWEVGLGCVKRLASGSIAVTLQTQSTPFTITGANRSTEFSNSKSVRAPFPRNLEKMLG